MFDITLKDGEFFMYYRQALEDIARLFSKRGDDIYVEGNTYFYSATSPSRLDRVLSRQKDLPDSLKEALRGLYSNVDKVNLKWNLEDWEGKYSFLGLIDVPDVSYLLNNNVNPSGDAYWDISSEEEKEVSPSYLSDLNLSKAALKKFVRSLPKLYVFDYYGEEVDRTVIWVKGDRWGLAILKDGGDSLIPLGWSLETYLYYQVMFVGLFHWPRLALKGCTPTDMECISKWITNSYSITGEQLTLIEDFLKEVWETVGSVKDTLLRAYIPWGRKVKDDALNRIGEILDEGADPNSRFGDGDTPLTRAARGSDTRLIELLLKYGADPNLRGENGKRPVDTLLEKSKKDVKAIALLVTSGMELDDDLVKALVDAKIMTKTKVKKEPVVQKLVAYLKEKVNREQMEILRETFKKLGG